MHTPRSWVVTVNGWLLTVCAVVVLFFAKSLSSGERISALMTMVLCAAVGPGLLMRRNWARWLALGMSLITWTVGSVLLFLGVVGAYKSITRPRLTDFDRYLRPESDRAILFFSLGIFVAICAVGIWLNFRLFEHLRSDAGREEFNTPETEKHAVAKSTAVYVAWYALSVFMVAPGLFGLGHSSREDLAEGFEQLRRLEAERARTSQADEEDMRDRVREAREKRRANDDRAREARERQLANENAALAAQRDAAIEDLQAARESADSMQRQLARDEAREEARASNDARLNAGEEFRDKMRELINRRVHDPNYTDAQFEADRQRLQREFQASTTRRSADSYPGSAKQTVVKQPTPARDRPSSSVLKCRDASGAISFTQGYCPAGTTLVEAPPAD